MQSCSGKSVWNDSCEKVTHTGQEVSGYCLFKFDASGEILRVFNPTVVSLQFSAEKILLISRVFNLSI